MIEGINSPAPQPEDRFQNVGPGYDEDPDIGIELEDGVFYQASHGGIEVAIVADYLDLIPSSDVNTQDIPPQREDSQRASPISLFMLKRGGAPHAELCEERHPRGRRLHRVRP